jgi:hypothetical protein
VGTAVQAFGSASEQVFFGPELGCNLCKQTKVAHKFFPLRLDIARFECDLFV